MKNVLIVDDDVQISYHIESILKKCDADCVALMEPLHLFENLDYEVPDLILLDVMMPGISGVTLLQQLQAHPTYNSIPVVMITGESDRELMADCFDNGASDFIRKPIDEHELKARVKSIFRIQDYQQSLENEIQERKRTEAKLVQSAKMASLGRIGAGIAHELNTPLAVIKLSAFEMLDDWEDQHLDEFPEILKRIDRQVDKAAKVTEHLITFSGDMKPEQFNRISPEVLTEKFLGLVRESMKIVDTQLEVDVDKYLPEVEGSLLLLEQALLSLVHNSIHAMEKSDVRKISLKVFRKDDNIVWELSDTGCGIPDQFKENIFDPFFTTKEVGKGCGLGLSSSYGIVEDHKGQLTLKETSAEGTTFQMCLPIAREEAI